MAASESWDLQNHTPSGPAGLGPTADLLPGDAGLPPPQPRPPSPPPSRRSAPRHAHPSRRSWMSCSCGAYRRAKMRTGRDGSCPRAQPKTAHGCSG